MQPWNQLYRELKRYKEEGEVARKNDRGERGKEREREREGFIDSQNVHRYILDLLEDVFPAYKRLLFRGSTFFGVARKTVKNLSFRKTTLYEKLDGETIDAYLKARSSLRFEF